MMQTVAATFEDGVLKPAHPLNLPDLAQLRVSIEPPESGLQMEWNARKEERLAALKNLIRMAKVHPGEHLTRDQLHERR